MEFDARALPSPGTGSLPLKLNRPREAAAEAAKRRIRGLIGDFHLLLQDRGLVLSGRAHTYYAKQLAQHAVMEATDLPILANDIEVS